MWHKKKEIKKKQKKIFGYIIVLQRLISFFYKQRIVRDTIL